MKTKTSRLLGLLLVAALAFTGCKSQNVPPETPAAPSAPESSAAEQPSVEGTQLSYKPGTYTGEADGYGGKLKLEVTVSETAIQSIKVTENHETQGIGSTAVEQLPEIIVKSQSLGVDTITGCTYSSKAILEATANALEASGVDVNALKTAPIANAGNKATETLTTQVLVIGGGGSGISASITASDAGAQVLLVEKMPFLGGAASISGGQVNSGGSEYQKTKGITNDSPETIAADLMKGGHDLNDKMLVDLYSKAVGPTFDWMVNDVGVKFEPDVVKAAEHSVDRIFIGEGKAAGINDSMLKKLESTKTDVKLNTKVTQLIVENDKVVGAKAEDTAGTQYEIKADLVVLCTGGFGYNQDLLPQSLKPILYYGPVSSTGDGLVMAQELGAATQMLEYGKIYPNGIEIGPGIARSTISANAAVFNNTGTILVDRSGKRVANETGPYADIRTVLLDQPDKTLFLVMDQEAFDLFREKCKENKYANDQELDQWVANNGSIPPVFANNTDLTAAAAAAGVDGKALTATVDEFNKMVAAGNDTTFGRKITKPLGDGPFYIVEQKPRFATTLGGIKINDKMEVVKESGETIPGLMAAGEVIGGLHGDDSMPSVCVSWAFTSGRLAGLSASEAVAAK